MADDARAVAVFEEEDGTGWGDFDGTAVDADDAGVVFCAEERAADGDFRFSAEDSDVEPFVKIGLLAGADFFDVEAACGGHSADVDAVNLLAAGVFEKSGEDRAANGVGGHFDGFSAVGDDDAVVAVRGELGGEASEFITEGEVGFDDDGGFGVHARHVDGVADFAIEECGANGLGNFDADIFLGLCGAGSEVWREDDIRQCAEREVCRRRLDFEDIEGGCGDLAGFEGLAEGGFVDETATGAVDDTNAFAAEGEPTGVEHVLRFRREGHVHRDEVGEREQSVEFFNELDLQAPGAADGEVRIVGDNAHTERDGAARELGADAAHAEDAERLVIQFDAFVFFAIPLAGLHAGIGLGNAAGNAHDEGKRVLGGRDRVAAGGVHHDYAVAGGGIDVHVVHTDARTADDFEFRSGIENGCRDFCLAAHDECGERGDDFEKLGFGKSGLDDDFEGASCGEFIDTALGNGIGDEDFQSGRWHFLLGFIRIRGKVTNRVFAREVSFYRQIPPSETEFYALVI